MSIDAQDPRAALDQLHDLMRDPERVRQLVPPEIMERFGGAPEWTRQTAEEREEHLRQHVRSEHQRGDRRLQWMWEDSDEQARESSLANALPSPEAGCSAAPMASPP